MKERVIMYNDYLSIFKKDEEIRHKHSRIYLELL